MVSMITLGVSFLMFFVVLGFMWSIGIHILSELFEKVDFCDGFNPNSRGPENQPGGEFAWCTTNITTQNQIKTILIWVPPILLLFASIKMLSNAASRGAD